MRKFASLTFAGAMALAAVGMATSASATNFVGTFNVTPNTDPGLVIKTNPDNGPINGASGFSLTAVNQTFTVNNLFTMYTDEESIQGDDTVPDGISVFFNFTSPTTSGTETGTVQAIDGAFLDWNYGQVTWNNPTILNFGNGGKLQITLSDATFNSQFDTSLFSDPLNEGVRNGANIKATFKLLAVDAGGAGAVPEPATWAMMIMGFGMAGAVVRRRRTAATFA